jgi:hypothetical protein
MTTSSTSGGGGSLGGLAQRARVKLALRSRLRAAAYRRRFGFSPPPAWSDLSGYETILDVLATHRIAEVEGDVVEIGAFLGGGTYQLCRYFERNAPGKRVHVVDIFDPGFDVSTDEGGMAMADVYASILHGRDQRSIYHEITHTCRNLVTIMEDSAQVELPCSRVAFAHIDGNHTPEYVRSDFHLVWPLISSGGIVSFDDYGHDVPPVTTTVDELVEAHDGEVASSWTEGLKTIFLKKI